jgi:hypothetical protein
MLRAQFGALCTFVYVSTRLTIPAPGDTTTTLPIVNELYNVDDICIWAQSNAPRYPSSPALLVLRPYVGTFVYGSVLLVSGGLSRTAVRDHD